MDQNSIDPHGVSGGFRDLVGYRLVRWEEGYAEVELDLAGKHKNRSGRLHGGALTTVMDAACGFAGTWCSVPGNVRRALTLSLTAQFVSGGEIGEKIVAKARLAGGGRTVFFAACEVFGADGRLVARGDGTFRYKSGSHAVEGQPA